MATPDLDGLGSWEAPEVVLCEGFQAFHDESLTAQMGLRVWLHVSENTARVRRMATSPVPPGYFEECIWACRCEYRARVLPPSCLARVCASTAASDASPLLCVEDSGEGSRGASPLVCLDGEAAVEDILVEALMHVRRVLGEAEADQLADPAVGCQEGRGRHEERQGRGGGEKGGRTGDGATLAERGGWDGGAQRGSKWQTGGFGGGYGSE